jgi:hypothetical protein
MEKGRYNTSKATDKGDIKKIPAVNYAAGRKYQNQF